MARPCSMKGAGQSSHLTISADQKQLSTCRGSPRPNPMVLGSRLTGIIPTRTLEVLGHRTLSRLSASVDEQNARPSSVQTITIWPTQWSLPRWQYQIGEGLILLVILGIVDAAYSGDWSRIGVISVETESALQSYVKISTAIHAAIGVAAAVAASRGSGMAPPEAFARGFFFGVAGFWEVYSVTQPKATA